MHYKKPPLPFMGNKKNMLKQIKEVLENMLIEGSITKALHARETQKSTIFYDVFGGSGLVSHFVKKMFPFNRVIWNDFDNYQERLNHIEETEEVRQWLFKLLPNIKNFKITKEQKKQIKEYLDKQDYLDFITLSTYLCFSGLYNLNKEDLYANIRYSRVATQSLTTRGYLEGVERVRMDFKELIRKIPKEQKESAQAFLILDPPYLQTHVGNYKDSYFLRDFLLLVESVNKPYIFFSSEKSDILPFLDFYGKYSEVFRDFSFNKSLLSLNSTNKQKQEDYIIYSCRQKGLFKICDF